MHKLILLVCFLGLVSVAGASTKTESPHAMSLKIYKKLEEANELIEEGDNVAALELLAETLEKRLSKYERAQIWYLTGSIHYKMEKEDQAITAFTKVLDAEGKIPIFLELNTLKTLTQMNMVRENYDLALDYCTKLIERSEVPKAKDYGLKAQVYYKLERWEEVLGALKQAHDIDTLAGRNPNENLLVLQNATYFQLQDMENMVSTLEVLLKHYPKTTYLLYLSSVYGQLEETDKQTVLMESLYENEKLANGSQLVNLASLFLSSKVPYKAAKLMENGIDDGRIKASKKHYEMLSQAWRMAAEPQRSADALEFAADLSEDGMLHLQRAYIQYDMTQWENTKLSVHKALDKGVEEDRIGEAWLLVGMSNFNLMKFEDAIEACQRASEYKESKRLAEQWISYISSEQAKLEALQAGL